GDTVAARLGVPPAEVAAAVERAKAVLYERRARRVWPGRDEKILASWNGLMVRALAEAARAFDDADLASRAERSGRFLFDALVRDGRARRSWHGGEAKIAGYLEDSAALGLAALALYELTFDRAWLDRARALSDACVRWFWDDQAGAFFDTAADHETLITRPR